jgi:exodeoxyribonuclease V alpha subunit
VNDLTINILQEAGMIAPDSLGLYKGEPILITGNDPEKELFNGDLGLTVERKKKDDKTVIEVRFPARTERFLPQLLPESESAYAITVHKSQGGEYGKILVILPGFNAETPNQIMTKELLYTAVTRARKEIEIWCDADAFKAALLNPTKRTSGLAERLKDRN